MKLKPINPEQIPTVVGATATVTRGLTSVLFLIWAEPVVVWVELCQTFVFTDTGPDTWTGLCTPILKCCCVFPWKRIKVQTCSDPDHCGMEMIADEEIQLPNAFLQSCNDHSYLSFRLLFCVGYFVFCYLIYATYTPSIFFLYAFYVLSIQMLCACYTLSMWWKLCPVNIHLYRVMYQK